MGNGEQQTLDCQGNYLFSQKRENYGQNLVTKLIVVLGYNLSQYLFIRCEF